VEHALPLAAWESFYVIVGTSAAALTGLQFVVIALGAEADALTTGSMRAFGTPTIVHFGAVVLVSALASAPWPGLGGIALALLACGVAGLVYVLAVLAITRRQTDYKPVLEDWIWHTVLPPLAYLALVVAALCLRRAPVPCLFAVGGAALLLLFTGIHNAWDAVLYIAIGRKEEAARQAPR
jgi:hypothetical protein